MFIYLFIYFSLNKDFNVITVAVMIYFRMKYNEGNEREIKEKKKILDYIHKCTAFH